MTKINQNPIFVLIFFLIFGCEKWSDTPNNELNGLLIKIENEDHEQIEKYTYDRNNNLKSSWHKFEHYYLGSKAEYSYEYNSKDLLIKKEGFEPGNPILSSFIGAMDKDVIYTYEYDSDNRIFNKKIYYDYNEYSDINFSMNFSYEYPDKNTVIEQSNTINELANSISNYRAFNYSTEGNIIEIIAYHFINNNEKRVYSKEEYIYDNKNAPINFDPIPQSKNNVIKKKTTAYNYDENEVQSVAYSSTYQYEYTYNSDGYPESMTETWPNDQLFIKYYYYKN